MAILSIAVFGTALASALWAIWTTVAPQSARIVDLLLNGPEYAPRPVTVLAPRGGLRDVRLRPAPVAASRRAAA